MIFERLKERIIAARFFSLHLRSPAAIKKAQEIALQKLVQRAAKNVPLWREIFAQHDIDPSSIRTKSDLKRLPVTTKRTYLGRMAEEYIDGSGLPATEWLSTSGSSGIPFNFMVGHLRFRPLFDDMIRLRFLVWNGMLPSKLASVRSAFIRLAPLHRENQLYISLFEYYRDPAGTVERVAAFKPHIIESYGSIIAAFAEVAETHPSIYIPYATSYGEMLTSAARALIQKKLGSEIYDRYGIKEVGVIACECRIHNGQHIYEDLFIVEVVDERGEPLSHGKRGRIIVTDLYNYNMPFIRYETGDHGYIEFASCPCGLRLPRLQIEGRASVSLIFGNRKIHHLLFEDILSSHMNRIVQYQFVKRSEKELTVRIVPLTQLSDTFLNGVVKSVEKLVGVDVAVRTEIVRELARLPDGKAIIVLDESKKI